MYQHLLMITVRIVFNKKNEIGILTHIVEPMKYV